MIEQGAKIERTKLKKTIYKENKTISTVANLF